MIIGGITAKVAAIAMTDIVRIGRMTEAVFARAKSTVLDALAA